MARAKGGGKTFEELVISGVGQLRHDTLGKSLITFILVLCIWTFIVHWSLVLPVTWRADPLAAALSTSLHHLLHGLLVYSLYRAVTTDPGFVPPPSVLQKQGSRGQAVAGFCDNWCLKCAHTRPSRAHHCKVCNRCVKKMDHHCLFVNNCVGAHNYKFFVLLLLYTVVGGAYNGAISYVWLGLHQRRGDNVLDLSRAMVVGNGCTIAVIAMILLPFVSVHMYLAGSNKTTLEALKGSGTDYDLGSVCRNLKHVFGANPFLWLSPFHNQIHQIHDTEPLLGMV